MNLKLKEFIEFLKKNPEHDDLLKSAKRIRSSCGLNKTSSTIQILNKLFIDKFYKENKSNDEILLLNEKDLDQLNESLDRFLNITNGDNLITNIGNLSLNSECPIGTLDAFLKELEINQKLEVPEDAKEFCCYYCKLGEFKVFFQI